MNTDRRYVAYIGTYTRENRGGIYICDVDAGEGSLTLRKSVPAKNASHICRSRNGKYLYTIDDDGIAVFAVQPDGDLEPAGKVDIDGMRGCHISEDRAGKHLFVAGYHDGKVTMIRILEDGRPGEVLDGVYHSGTGSVAERNFRPRVSCVRMTPDDRYLCAVDNGIDRIVFYRVTDAEKLEKAGTVHCHRESGPRALRFFPDGRFAYVLNELDNTVDAYVCPDGQKPEFDKIQTISTTSDNVDQLHDAGAALEISPDGRHLFASTAGDDTVALFDVDPETGLLTKRFALPVSGEYPKDIALFPDGAHIACANHGSGSVTTFSVDYEKGLLVMKGRPLRVPTPSCIMITGLFF